MRRTQRHWITLRAWLVTLTERKNRNWWALCVRVYLTTRACFFSLLPFQTCWSGCVLSLCVPSAVCVCVCVWFDCNVIPIGRLPCRTCEYLPGDSQLNMLLITEMEKERERENKGGGLLIFTWGQKVHHLFPPFLSHSWHSPEFSLRVFEYVVACEMCPVCLTACFTSSCIR